MTSTVQETEAPPAMRYRWGFHRPDQPTGPGARQFEAVDQDEALDQLFQAIAEAFTDDAGSTEDGGRYRDLHNAWAAFSRYVGAMSHLGSTVCVAGPDGLLYYLEPIE